MSELQISLLVIGIAMIVAVYVYNLWVQRQYQRKFGAAFKRQEELIEHMDISPMIPLTGGDSQKETF